MRTKILCFLLSFWVVPAMAEPNRPAYMQPRTFLLKQFGLTERMTFRKNHEGANLSTLVSWEPQYRSLSPWVFGGLLGLTRMTSQREDFIAIRYHLSISYEGLACWIYPELFYGGETWTASVTSTYTSFGANVNLRLLPTFTAFEPLARILESWVAGYQVVFARDYVANQFNLGVRFAF